MTALAAGKATAIREGAIATVRLAPNTTIYQGALLQIANGLVSPATKGGNLRYWGIALDAGVSGAADDVRIETRLGVTAHLATDATLDTDAEKRAALGAAAYVVDDQTVSTTAAGSTSAGVIVDFDDDGVWVRLAN